MAEKKEQSRLAEYIIIASAVLAAGSMSYVTGKIDSKNASQEYHMMNQKEFIDALNRQPDNKIESKQTVHLRNQQKARERSL